MRAETSVEMDAMPGVSMRVISSRADVGHSTIGAKINNRLVPLDYRLRNGDIVEIVTTKAEHGPSRDWMNIVRTSHAREKIRQWFKRKDRDENIVHGREALERELRRLARASISSNCRW